MSKPQRIQLRRTKGWRMPEGTIRSCRPSVWGNPFVIGEPHPEHGRPMTRADAVEAYDQAISGGLLCYRINLEEYLKQRKWRGAFDASAVRSFLRGKNLACWCPLPAPGEPDVCHAAVLLEIANAP